MGSGCGDSGGTSGLYARSLRMRSLQSSSACGISFDIPDLLGDLGLRVWGLGIGVRGPQNVQVA